MTQQLALAVAVRGTTSSFLRRPRLLHIRLRMLPPSLPGPECHHASSTRSFTATASRTMFQQRSGREHESCETTGPEMLDPAKALDELDRLERHLEKKMKAAEERVEKKKKKKKKEEKNKKKEEEGEMEMEIEIPSHRPGREQQFLETNPAREALDPADALAELDKLEQHLGRKAKEEEEKEKEEQKLDKLSDTDHIETPFEVNRDRKDDALEPQQKKEEAKKEKGKKERPPAPTPTYPEPSPLPRGAHMGDIPIPILPNQIRGLYSYMPYLCLGPSSGSISSLGEPEIVPQPLPSHRDLIASHELFAHSKLDCRWGKPEFIRCSSSVPDVALIGRMKVGKSTLINRLAQDDIIKQGGTPNWKKVGVVPVIQSVLAFGFSPTPMKKKSQPRFRIYELPGYGHKLSAVQNQQFGTQVFKKRAMCRGCLLIVNTPHGIKEHDRMMLEVLAYRQTPFVVLLNKAESTLPRLGESEFPVELWHHLINVAKDVYNAADKLGARPFLRGVYVIGGSSRAYDKKCVGLLGVKYAIARLAGLVGEDNWGRPLIGKVYSEVTREEAPLAYSSDATSDSIKYFSPTKPDNPPTYTSQKMEKVDLRRTDREVYEHLMERKLEEEFQAAKQESGKTGSDWRRQKANVRKTVMKAGLGDGPRLIPTGRERLDQFQKIEEVEDMHANHALNGTEAARRMQQERFQRKLERKAAMERGQQVDMGSLITSNELEQKGPLKGNREKGSKRIPQHGRRARKTPNGREGVLDADDVEKLIKNGDGFLARNRENRSGRGRKNLGNEVLHVHNWLG